MAEFESAEALLDAARRAHAAGQARMAPTGRARFCVPAVPSRCSMFRSSPLLWFVAAVLLATACTQKMAQQPSLRPFQPSTEFADGTSARPLPADTVARGQLRDE